MTIVAFQYRKTKEEIQEILNDVQDNDITPEVLLAIDFAYHNTDANYNHGLSFLDRIYEKLSRYFDIQWNVENLKSTIQASNIPSTTFVDILNEILTPEMVVCYGV
jgi:hypothetical protein